VRTITQSRIGDPDVLQIVETDAPVPAATEVLVEVRATSVNPVDVAVRAGTFPLLGEPPFVLGWDVSGVVVESLPRSSARFRPGDEVFGFPLFPRPGATNAELVVAPSRQLVRKPASLSHVEAAALPLAGLTAWQALVDTAAVQDGQRVLIHGGGGGVGHLAVQIASALGAEVIVTASGPKHEWLRKLGAHRTIDHRTEDFTDLVSDVDVVVDTVLGGPGRRSLDVLRPGGLLVTIVDHFDDDLPAEAAAKGVRAAGVSVEPDQVGLDALVDLVERGVLRPHVQEVFPFERIADAHRAVEQGGLTGKVVVSLIA
jgi:NADPH:quinone reductase-like Zn-dependent oxidoreductase